MKCMCLIHLYPTGLTACHPYDYNALIIFTLISLLVVHIGSIETTVAWKHITRRIVMIILLVYVVIISVALFVSIGCHFYRKEELFLHRRIYSSARDTSCNSSANLISYRSDSFMRTQHKTDTLLSPFTGIFRTFSSFFYFCESSK